MPGSDLTLVITWEGKSAVGEADPRGLLGARNPLLTILATPKSAFTEEQPRVFAGDRRGLGPGTGGYGGRRVHLSFKSWNATRRTFLKKNQE